MQLNGRRWNEINKEIEKLEGLNASQLARYKTRNAREIANTEKAIKQLREARREADKNKVYYAGQVPEDFINEVKLCSKLSRLEKIQKAIKRREKELTAPPAQKPTSNAGATIKLLKRLNQGHRKHAQDRAKSK